MTQQAYEAQVLRLARQLAILTPGAVARVQVAHDATCPKLTTGGACTCTPVVSLRSVTPAGDTVASVAT